MKYLVFVLAIGCADQPSCPDPDPPAGSTMTCHMVQFLAAKLDEDQLITDASVLTPQLLDARPGWTLFAADPAYRLGNPGPYQHGQTAVFSNGTISLGAFADNENGASFFQRIVLAEGGAVISNDVSRFPE